VRILRVWVGEYIDARQLSTTEQGANDQTTALFISVPREHKCAAGSTPERGSLYVESVKESSIIARQVAHPRS
jgi:hypothetical protein